MFHKLREFFYYLTHFREIRQKRTIQKRVANLLDEALKQAITGEKPVQIKTGHKAGWVPLDDSAYNNPHLQEDFIDLRKPPITSKSLKYIVKETK